MFQKAMLVAVVSLTCLGLSNPPVWAVEAGETGHWVGEPFGLEAYKIVEERITFDLTKSPARLLIDFELFATEGADSSPIQLVLAEGVSLHAEVDGQSVGATSQELRSSQSNGSVRRGSIVLPNGEAYREHTVHLPEGDGVRRLHLQYEAAPSYASGWTSVDYRYHNRDLPRERLKVSILIDPEEAEAVLGGCNVEEVNGQWRTIEKVLGESIFATANSINVWNLQSAETEASPIDTRRKWIIILLSSVGTASLACLIYAARDRLTPIYRGVLISTLIAATLTAGICLGRLPLSEQGNSYEHQRQMAMLANARLADEIEGLYWTKDRPKNKEGLPAGIWLEDVIDATAIINSAVSLNVARLDRYEDAVSVMLWKNPTTVGVFQIKDGRIEPTFAGCGSSTRQIIRNSDELRKYFDSDT